MRLPRLRYQWLQNPRPRVRTACLRTAGQSGGPGVPPEVQQRAVRQLQGVCSGEGEFAYHQDRHVVHAAPH
ncbi:hypothetical protein [Streptomyces rishiriensis]|uniref:5-methylcytosine-specific restriction endonuclease McrA n=1 Tax=Streptomyces rishiriensis TaxID=68264 RepID=A0ABU0NIN0_STRRH|nr:hypothetical protein [Streptomyces rishiriensis]MDQ0578683.1 5-methylcytosine-specific restriction endonuclease McrA [Streptomyces rishiriensis]